MEAEYRPMLGGGGCQPVIHGCYRTKDGVCEAVECYRGSVPEQVRLRDPDGHLEATGTPLHVTMM